MKIQNILVTAVLTCGLAQAAPTQVTIQNNTNTMVQFTLKTMSQTNNHFIKANTQITKYNSYTYTNISVLKKATWTTLDLQPYQGSVTISYDGTTLNVQSTTPQSPLSRLMGGFVAKGISYHLIALREWGGNVWKNVREKWNSLYTPKTPLSTLTPCHVHNKLDSEIKFSAGEVQYEDPKIIKPTKKEQFSLSGKNKLYIYKPEDTENAILVIDLQKYIDNPKANKALHIYIEKRSDWTNKLFGWMPNWSEITYSARWQEDKLNLE